MGGGDEIALNEPTRNTSKSTSQAEMEEEMVSERETLAKGKQNQNKRGTRLSSL